MWRVGVEGGEKNRQEVSLNKDIARSSVEAELAVLCCVLIDNHHTTISTKQRPYHFFF